MSIRRKFYLAIAVILAVWAVIIGILVESGPGREKHENLTATAIMKTNPAVQTKYHTTLTATAVQGQQTQTATAATAATQ